MSWSSTATWLRTRGNLRWVWVFAPAIFVFSALRSYPALQFLSAMLLFAAFSSIFVVLIFLLLLIFALLGCLIEWSVAALASSAHSILLSIHDAEISPARASSLSRAGSVPKNSNQNDFFIVT